jgi:Spy/CpxP family protein refolding chaperone
MSRAKLILIAAFAITLIAGGAAGYALRSSARHHSQGSGPHDPGAHPPHSPLPELLQLTPEQEAKMDSIWEGLRDSSKFREQRQAFQKQREEAVLAILTDEQKAKYDAVLKDYADKVAELGKAREAAFQGAIEKTKQILNTEQRKKYEEWLKTIHDDRRQGGPPPAMKGPPPPPPEKNGASTAPGSAT